ncbi:MAG: hypothetical protein PHF67_05210, partial [Candidatus Nanoarchaeia archaeon]|nr:hypothetical protein [Candidatus Nanoarchaeia archaeon]
MERNFNEISYRVLISLIFMIILILPITDSILHFTKNIGLEEHRKYARAPELQDLNISIINYLNIFEKYYNDHFDTRAALIKINSHFRYYLFRSSINEQVLIGEDDWIFNLGLGNCTLYSMNI